MPEQPRYAARLAAGVCVSCGQEPPAEGQSACPRCLEARRVYQATVSAQRRRTGTCLDCGKAPAAPGLYRCRRCADRQAARMRTRADT